MKSIKHRLLSLLLTLVTVLSLLPTAAFAASNTGSGLKITTNQAYWSTRLLANGTPYSYRPPLVDGKLVYCMDSGLGYHYATPSYLNSFTWTSGTGADADAVLQSAVTNSGLSEMDAATVENVKWMMTYLNDCKASNVGQLFMAVQTYVWDHQSYKGEPGGDGDAGGYANADTYDLYLSLIDWLLEQKAQEDAEFQRQIEEYTAQGKSASIVEDQSAKWAVYAISSNRKNQSFFNYYGPRKLVTQDKPGGGGEEPAPPAGVGKIVLKKTAGGTTTGLAGARFSIYFNGQIVGSDITNAQGEIYVEDAATGLWSFVETAAPDGFCVDPTPKSVYVDVSEGDREYTVAAVNYEKPDMKITKRDAMSGKPIAGTVFSIKSVTGNYSTSVTTGVDGSATLSAIPADVYVVREESVPEPYIVSNTEQTVALRPGKTSEVTFVDYEKPGLEIVKKNIANGEPIEGVTYRIEQIDGSFSTSATTDNHGRIFLDSVPVGTFKVTEINVPNHVILCPIPQIGGEQFEGYTSEEMKMQNEGRKIMHLPDLRVSCTCVRVPVVRSHSISVSLHFDRHISVEEARAAIAAAPGCRLVDDLAKHEYPMPLDTSDQDTVFVGRIRPDLTDDNGLCLWCCGDQVRKGAATNAVQIAELLLNAE